MFLDMALFYDTGMVAPRLDAIALGSFVSNVGVGIRFHAPVADAAAGRVGEGFRGAADHFCRQRGVLIMATPCRFAARFGLCCLLAAGPALLAGAERRFFDDDPLTRAPDTQDAKGVQEWEIDLFIDLATNLFAHPGDPATDVRARSINTIDEVPDSNWFTNRILARPLTAEEVARGPVTGTGPVPGPWTVVSRKLAGFAPGFTMRDSKGQLWFVSFDAAGHPEAATGAIMVANKIFWALGYWQVENYLITVARDQIRVSEEATFTPPSGRKRPMELKDLDDVFRRSHRSGDGTYRAVAARAIEGRPVGGFRYYGTRPDDPNDVVPHEHRRELRALKVFGAWTNLVDMKAGNTLDTVVVEDGRSVVRHYLQDVGSTFGTGANGPREYDEGWELLYDGGKTRQRLWRLGFVFEPWQTVHVRREPRHRALRGQGVRPRGMAAAGSRPAPSCGRAPTTTSGRRGAWPHSPTRWCGPRSRPPATPTRPRRNCSATC